MTTHEKEVVIRERRQRPTLSLNSGHRELDLLSWRGLVAIASGFVILYGAIQIVGSVTGLTINSNTSRKIDQLTEAVSAESRTRAAADSESREDRAFIRQQVGDLTLAVCSSLEKNASRAVRDQCDKIITNTYNRH